MISERRGVRRDDLVAIRWPMEPDLSADGARLAYVVSGPDAAADRVTYRLHLLDCRSGSTVAVDSQHDLRMPRWLSRDDRLICIAGTGLAVVEESGSIAPLPGSPEGVRLFDLSPDGRHAVVVTNRQPATESLRMREVESLEDLRGSSQDDFWLCSVDGGAPTRLPIEGVTAVEHLVWSPDGRRVAFTGRDRRLDSPAQVVSISVSDVATGEVTELVTPDGPVRAVAWSPGGDSIAFIGHRDGASHVANLELYVLPVAGGAPPRSLTASLDRSVGQVVRGDDERGSGAPDLAWTGDGILAAYARGGSSAVFRFGLDGSGTEIVGGQRAILGFCTSPKGQDLAFVWSDPANPGEISVSSITGSGERPVGAVNDEWLASVELAETVPVSVVASDGITIEGWLTTPSGESGRPWPLVLQVHGGPHYPVGNRFSFDAQRLATAGIAMLRANPRGAQGYGREFASAILADWGGRDFADLQEILDKVSARPDIDESRIAIVGESYGGFMVNWALTHDARFVAGIAENGISFPAGVATGLMGLDFWHHELGTTPWDSPELITASSPLLSAAHIKAPLLLIHAEADTTVPIAQSEAMYIALRSLGKDVRFNRIPQERHFVNLLGTPSRRMARLAAFDAFLKEHLLTHSAPPRDGDGS